MSVSREIAASSDVVWGLVSDLPRMGEWSNENVGGAWVGEPSGPEPGARFKGNNRNGFRRWSANVTVVDAVPGELFCFDVSAFGLPISQWAYELEPSGDGCRVTESWTDRRPGWFKPVARLATGVADRIEHTRAGMTQTLEGIAAEAESAD